MRIWSVFVCVLALNGCSPPSAKIGVEVRENDLIFTATSPNVWWPFNDAVDLRPDLVRVDHGGRLVWRIERKRDRRCLNYGGGGPSPVFPLTYGKVPPCFTEVVRAQPMTVGTVYRIAALGGTPHDSGRGYFQTGVAVSSFDSEPSGLASWGEVETVYNVAAAEPSLPETGVLSPTRTQARSVPRIDR